MAGKVCPFWIGYLLLSPLRRFFQNPDKILAPYISPDMTVMDYGSAMGYFSLPMARMVQPAGKVICVDIQERMLIALARRAERAGLTNNIETFCIDTEMFSLNPFYERIEFILCFAVAHEVPDQKILFTELSNALKSGGYMLLSEPSGHVNAEAFQKTQETAFECGFGHPRKIGIQRARTVLLEKANG
jgi:2-polyprenyl-3-methyl-5-hydroxy-6-metoxy-1,4-benzoquinol methylase